MKSLKPSHREKKRYLLVHGDDAKKEEIEKAILDYVGVLGFAKAGPQVIKKIPEGIILAVNREEIDRVRASILLSGKKIEIKKVSGTLRGLE